MINSQPFEGVIKFEHNVTKKNKKYSNDLYRSAFYNKDLIYNSFYKPYSATCFIKQDSILIEKYYRKKAEPDFYIYQKDSIPLLIDNSTGMVSKYVFYGRLFNPKFKIKKNSATIDILSLNAGDKRYDRIKSIISKKNMTWAQGFATEKIISILNSRKVYPVMVLLNDNMEVLFIGNLGVHLNKVQEIIKSL